MEAPILYVRPNVTEEKSLTYLRRKKGNIPKEQDVPTLSPYTRTDPFLTLKLTVSSALCYGLWGTYHHSYFVNKMSKFREAQGHPPEVKPKFWQMSMPLLKKSHSVYFMNEEIYFLKMLEIS